jgi:parallel beta-helix repeat protein
MLINRTDILACTAIHAISIALGSSLIAMPSLAQPQRLTQIIYVSLNGSDRLGNGNIQAPFRTISKALAQISVRPNPVGVIQLGKGTYSLGESFPLRLPPNLILRGDEATQGAGVTILGGGLYSLPDFPKLNVTILPSDRSELRGVTVTNPYGFGIWIDGNSPIITGNRLNFNNQQGISIIGNSNALISNNHFLQNRLIGISIGSNASPIVRGNLFQNSALGIDIRQRATPQISENLIRNNQTGILVQASSRPWLRQNRIESNRQYGMLVLSEALPDLGAIAEPGKNIFRNNLNTDIHLLGSQAIQLDGNQFERAKVQGRLITANSRTVAISTPNLSAKQNSLPSGQQTNQLADQSSNHSNNQPAIQPSDSGLNSDPSREPLRTPVKSGSISVTRANNQNPLIGQNNPVESTIAAPSFNPTQIPIPRQALVPAIQSPLQSAIQPQIQPWAEQIARSSIIRTTPKSSDQPPTPSAHIDQSLPPVALTPPPGAIVNRPIILAPKSRPQTQPLVMPRFRVIVQDQQQIEAIRRTFPQAFPSRLGDRSVVQVGAFGDRGLANLLVQNLNREGFEALIEALP